MTTWEMAEMDFDDTVCVVCGRELPVGPIVGTCAFDGFCSDECEEKSREAEADTMERLYDDDPEPEPLTRVVYVKWEGDEEETAVPCTEADYQTLLELVGEVA